MLAYEFVRPSYDVVLKRLETVELRIRAILTLAATLTLAGPVFIPSFAGKREPFEFDTVEWPRLILGNGPPVVRTTYPADQ
jgi:hypothetical protein